MTPIIETSKGILELVQKGMTVELQKKIMQLREEALELQEENLMLKAENIDLKKKVELQEKVKFERKVYYRDGDDVPFCPYCYDRHRLLIHLSLFNENSKKEQYPHCQECKTQYRVVGVIGDEDFIYWGKSVG